MSQEQRTLLVPPPKKKKTTLAKFTRSLQLEGSSENSLDLQVPTSELRLLLSLFYMIYNIIKNI